MSNRLRVGVLSVFLALSLTQCSGNDSMSVDLHNTQGQKVGTAKLSESDKGVKLTIDAAGLPPGKHGFHLHTTGSCQGPDFKSAGDHYNPDGKKHGHENPDGHHAGDFPNVEVAQDGTLKVEILTKDVTLEKGKPNSLRKEGGTAMVLHEAPDDYKTDPSGDSGARLVCGEIH
ncbi:superoxide dismutase [Cu-Zn] 2 [Paenibacillus sp. J31TS4]|uniref:superoxide dismutase family protein n=1 Tax=Paenibacillus sp. J31TS4 TaxID=2807195 RepID=UPI001B0918EB|nr:superoxide dismutase family protein [Paenibacillus sp. J31TS4]GIP38353.1 superoxide dismutase [Cu-Zn] 2 [Paenibacillus sp. J31TS4]